MTKISFDRVAVGIVEKAQWTDAEDLGQVGAAVGKLNTYGVAVDLPEGDNAGVAALRTALDKFRDYMSMAVLEYSDACSVLVLPIIPKMLIRQKRTIVKQRAQQLHV